MEALTEVERRRCHVPDQAKVGANVVSEELSCAVNPGIGKCGTVCGDRVRRQNPLGNNVTNFTKSHDFNSTRLAN